MSDRRTRIYDLPRITSYRGTLQPTGPVRSWTSIVDYDPVLIDRIVQSSLQKGLFIRVGQPQQGQTPPKEQQQGARRAKVY